MKTAILITIGDEILSGTTLDTNSNFIAEQLKSIGIKVQEIRTISDEVVAIENAFLWAMESTDIVVATGGLGPTKDDKTKKVLAKVFQDNLLLDALTFQHLKNYLKEKNRLDILEINYTQAEIPSQAKVFQNEYGTAPALMMEKNDKILFCLPGVPYEVKPLMKDKIIPYLRKQFATEFILSKTISVVDVAESILSQNIESWEINLPKNMQLSYLPIANRIKLKLTATGVEKNEVEKQLQQQIHLLKPLIIENVISWDGDKIEEILQQILLQKKWTLSVAESCTGGELSKLITSVSGSSAYFLGGVIAYDYHKKIQILNVNAETIAQKTVVSEEVAREMALGSQQLFASDIAISTTGVAGPNSDAFNNQVGKVYYTIRIKEFEKTFSLFLPHVERKDFMNFVAMKTLQDLIKCIQLFEKI
jgi:nicotinamide-nucleotide amidase